VKVARLFFEDRLEKVGIPPWVGNTVGNRFQQKQKELKPIT
jgi:hypothetical protein